MTQTAIIGAGPYGLALAAHLRQRQIPFRIFGRPMESWVRYMPEGMYLKSEGFASNIADPHGEYTLEMFCRRSRRPYGSCGEPVSVETFAAYGLWFQETLVPQVEPTEALSVRAESGGFEVVLATREVLHAQRVVVATGHVPHRYVPPELGDVPADRLSHSADHRDFRRFAGKDVAVVGGGQSALETAALLREDGANPVVLVRKESVSWNGPPSLDHAPAQDSRRRTLRDRLPRPVAPLGAGWRLWFYSELPMVFSAFPETTRIRLVREVLGPAGGWWLRDRVEGYVKLLPGHSVVGVTPADGKLRLRLVEVGVGGKDLVVDELLAATGYRVDLDRLTFLDPELRARLRRVQGAPLLSSSFESSVPRLYFVGLAAAHTFGPLMRFVCGTGFAARRVTGHVLRAQRAQAAGMGSPQHAAIRNS
jgi:FAD-dependent urate hydroxylase